MGEHGSTSGHSHADTAGTRMRLLQQEITQPRARTTDTGRSRPVHAPPPLDLGIIDHLQVSRDEVIQHAKAANPDAGPPPRAHEVYAWLETATSHLDGEAARARDTMLARQALEHAIKAGEESIVRHISCPACGCWGLFWDGNRRAAACFNVSCHTAVGRPTTWTLGQLAHHQVRTAPRSVAT